MPYLVRVRFVNNSGSLSPKTYEYKIKTSLPNGTYSQYFNIETADGNNYRNSKVVIIDTCLLSWQEYADRLEKEIVAFREAGAPISEKHLKEMGKKNAIVPKEQCDDKLAPSDSINYISNLNQCNCAITSNPYSLGKWFEEFRKPSFKNVFPLDDSATVTITNNLNKTKEKENKPMFENIARKFKFGPVHKSVVKMSPFGIAFRNNEDSWVTINDEGVMTSVEGMVFDMPLIYMMPVAVKDVQIGDYIGHNGDWVKVMDENERGNLVCLHPWRGEEVNVIPAKSPFGFDFVTKLVCFGEDMFTGKDASAQSPFGSMLPFMLMANGDMNDNSMLPLMLMMQNNGGVLDMSNPFMLMALMGDKNGSKNDLMLPLMYSMMAKKEHKCDGHCKNCEN